jgi:hypothetical protein
MSNFLRLVFGILALSIAAIVIAVGVGRAQPIPRQIAMLHLDDCQPPCCLGIVPGKTTIEEAEKIVASQYGQDFDVTVDREYANFSFIGIEQDTFSMRVRLSILKSTDGTGETVGDVVLYFLRDDRANYTPTTGDIISTVGSPNQLLMEEDGSGGYLVEFVYDNGLAFVLEWIQGHMTFTTHVQAVYFDPLLEFNFDNVEPWQGFVELAKYRSIP